MEPIATKLTQSTGRAHECWVWRIESTLELHCHRAEFRLGKAAFGEKRRNRRVDGWWRRDRTAAQRRTIHRPECHLRLPGPRVTVEELVALVEGAIA